MSDQERLNRDRELSAMVRNDELIGVVYGCHTQGGKEVHVGKCPDPELSHFYDGGGFYRVEIPRLKVRRSGPTGIGLKHPWFVQGGPLAHTKVFTTWADAQEAADKYARQLGERCLR